jgi:hypothetical protein
MIAWQVKKTDPMPTCFYCGQTLDGSGVCSCGARYGFVGPEEFASGKYYLDQFGRLCQSPKDGPRNPSEDMIIG